MRLLLVSQDFPPHIGGIQTYSMQLAKHLASWCSRLEVVAPYVDGCKEVDRTLDMKVHRVPSSTDALIVRGMPTLMRRAWSGEFDAAFHAQWSTAPGSLLARRSGRPRRVFVAAHGRELLLRPAAKLAPAQYAYDATRRWAMRSADGIFAVSRYTANLARGLGVDATRVHVVPNGVEAGRFDLPDADARIKRFREQHDLVGIPSVTTVARLVPHKGIDTGIKALPALRKRVPNATYVVVGSGPDTARLTALAQSLGVADAVRLLGRVSDRDVVDALLACDAFALLSREAVPDVEGFGLVLLEAGACGRPVVGTRSGGIPDAVADGISGLLVDPDDIAATADALAQILGNPDLATRLGDGGRRRAREVLTWERAARAIFETMEASLGPLQAPSSDDDDEEDEDEDEDEDGGDDGGDEDDDDIPEHGSLPQ